MPSNRGKDRSGSNRYPCVVCEQTVTVHQKALQCDSCDEWTHFKCTPLTCTEYSDLARSSNDWYCANCEPIGLEREEVDTASLSSDSPSDSGDSGSGSDMNEPPDIVNGAACEGQNNAMVNVVATRPNEEILTVLEDDFIKNLGNLVDVLKMKFERIHEMQARNKQLETENQDLRLQVLARDEEIAMLKHKQVSQENSQDEVRRLNNVIKGLREALSNGDRPRTFMTSVSASRAADSLVDRQGRMVTVLSRMTNFLSGLSDDLSKTDCLPTNLSDAESHARSRLDSHAPARSRVDDHSTRSRSSPDTQPDISDLPRPKKFKKVA